MAEDVVLLAVGALPLTIVDRADYAAAIPEAMERFGQRDPDDAELLALALTLDVPLWSNDKDFDRTGVTRFTTNALLRQLAL
ncbi:MAG: PIN domain-containing protein [Terriglobia bacterium]